MEFQFFLIFIITMSTPSNDERSLKKRLKRKLRSLFPSKSTESSGSRNLDAQATQPIATNVPSTTASPLSASPAHRTSRVDIVSENVILNPPSTLAGPLDTGELVQLMPRVLIERSTPARRSWTRYGRTPHKLSTSRQNPRQPSVRKSNGYGPADERFSSRGSG